MNAKDAWLKQVKYNRKRLKGLPRVGFNSNAGNVEHNITMFNKMNAIGDFSNNPISGPFGGDVNTSSSAEVGVSMGESYKQVFNDLRPAFKLFIEDYIDYIEHNDFDALYDMLDSSIAQPDELTDVLLGANIDPITYFDRYLPSGYASGLPIIDIEIPNNIHHIASFAFYACPLLSKVDIMDGVKEIGEQAFSDCPNLVEINLPKTILHLQRCCFANCWQLRDVYYHGTMNDFTKVALPLAGGINKNSDFKCIHCLDGDYYID